MNDKVRDQVLAVLHAARKAEGVRKRRLQDAHRASLLAVLAEANSILAKLAVDRVTSLLGLDEADAVDAMGPLRFRTVAELNLLPGRVYVGGLNGERLEVNWEMFGVEMSFSGIVTAKYHGSVTADLIADAKLAINVDVEISDPVFHAGRKRVFTTCDLADAFASAGVLP